MPTLEALAEQLESYMPSTQINQVCRAYFYAEQAHTGQFRRSGEPYIIHPLAVAEILAEMNLDAQTLMAAMLHDVIEDTGVKKDALQVQFGDTVAELVDGVSKLTSIDFDSKAQQQAENFQKMAMAMARDIRVILVKLGDRLHNMRTLGSLKPEKRRRIARETLDIYAPIANRLGLHSLCVEMEELCFFAIYPMRAEMIRKAVRNARGQRAQLVEEISTNLRSKVKEHNINARVFGREKHLYSIYNKMREHSKPFSDIMDMFGFRLVTDSIDSCYRLLGLAHATYKPVSGRFKDYIAIPKANGYQSLHTLLIGQAGTPIELQIRTEEMEAMANYGIAAHWLYKSEKSEHAGHQKARQWVQNLLELQQNAGSPMEFIEQVKVDLFPYEIYIFTPKGEILELPVGSTPIDFAYAVHTDVGNHCIACRINRQFAPLSSKLENGQTVQIIIGPHSQPSPSWLSFVTTSKARSNIRLFLKHQRQFESINMGKRLLEKALSLFGKSFADIDEQHIHSVLEETELNQFDELLEEIGTGNRVAGILARRLLAANKDTDIDLNAIDLSVVPDSPLAIRGTEGIAVNFAKCCSPIPGDPIVGNISTGRGLVVHIENCKNMQAHRDNPEKCIALSWDQNINNDFSVNLIIFQEKQSSMVVQLANEVHLAEASVESINVQESDARMSKISLQVNVNSRQHLARVIRRIRHLRGVNRIVRSRDEIGKP